MSLYEKNGSMVRMKNLKRGLFPLPEKKAMKDCRYRIQQFF